MLELTRQLAAQGCELWAVSSTNNWVVEAGAEAFGIPAERVLAATLAVEDGLVTDRLLRVPTDELKQTAIEEVIARPVDAVFGNSMHDFAMLEKARDAYAIHPNRDLGDAGHRAGLDRLLAGSSRSAAEARFASASQRRWHSLDAEPKLRARSRWWRRSCVREDRVLICQRTRRSALRPAVGVSRRQGRAGRRARGGAGARVATKSWGSAP